jgi:hypothetical protein
MLADPLVTKLEWDAISALHQKIMALCYPEGLNKEDREAFAELLDHMKYAGSQGDLLYLRIQKFHCTLGFALSTYGRAATTFFIFASLFSVRRPFRLRSPC